MTDYFDRLENELRSAVVREEAGERSELGAPDATTLCAHVTPDAGADGRADHRGARRRRRRGLCARARPTVSCEPRPKDRSPPARTPSSASGRPSPQTAPRDRASASASSIHPASSPAVPLRAAAPPTSRPDRGGDDPPRTALFGFAPKAAERVRIQADGKPGRDFPTHQTADPRGAFFFASLPENPDKLPGLRVVALDGEADSPSPRSSLLEDRC